MKGLLERLHQLAEQEDIFKPATTEKDYRERLEYWIKQNGGIKNPDGSYSFKGDVKVPDFLIKDGKFRIKFKRVGGNFDCYRSGLKALQGAPEYVGGDFWCSSNQLTSLQGAPKYVGGNFWCYGNRLTTLQGSPKEVKGSFGCSFNDLVTLKGAPKYVGGDFDCSENQLTSLQGAPKYVGGRFNCSNNPKKFTEEEVRKICKVEGEVKV